MQHGKLSLTIAKASSSSGSQVVGRCLAPLGWNDSQQYRHTHSKAENYAESLTRRPKGIDKDFFLSVLGASATKRDAKGYLSRFVASKKENVTPYARGVNLGELYSSPRAIAQAPYFSQSLNSEGVSQRGSKLHVAIVKLAQPQSLSEDELNGVALTLGQLARLGMPSAVVLDLGDPISSGVVDYQQWRGVATTEANRVAAAIRRIGKSSAHVLDQVLDCTANDGHVHVNYQAMLSKALQNLVIPVIPPVAYDIRQHATLVSPDDVVLAITRQFAGLGGVSNESSSCATKNMQQSEKLPDSEIGILLDRIIILDPVGGLPALDRRDNAHVFVNLNQEYGTIHRELKKASGPKQSQHKPLGAQGLKTGIDNATLSTSIEANTVTEAASPSDNLNAKDGSESATFGRHLRNLEILQQTLQLLPPSSSGLIIRPQDVAFAALTSPQESGVGTRQHRNPLIHNLLTDKPIVSSSLPSGRFSSPAFENTKLDGSPSADAAPHATFVKRGMPVTIIPDPNKTPWLPPGSKGTTLTLEDPSIDFPRLLHLIEDSFGRKLDIKHYLNRIQNRLAGVIIAGEYEGGAILTWEQPPSRGGEQRPPVPYLDKFAVLKRSQGAGGVADIVFNAMVRTSFPDGVVWRSRKNNPVNKWYFERADGTWKIPDTQWTMFWTGDELWSSQSEADKESWKRERWKDYIGVCQNIEASWADTKAPD